MAAIRDPYKILGVDKRASADEIKRAYRTLEQRHTRGKLVLRP